MNFLLGLGWGTFGSARLGVTFIPNTGNKPSKDLIPTISDALYNLDDISIEKIKSLPPQHHPQLTALVESYNRPDHKDCLTILRTCVPNVSVCCSGTKCTSWSIEAKSYPIDFTWNGVKIDPDGYYCYPVDFHQEERTPKPPSRCPSSLGSLVVEYDSINRKFTQSCVCKYPDIFNGESCDQYVACGIIQRTQDNKENIIRVGLKDNYTTEVLRFDVGGTDPTDLLANRNLRDKLVSGAPRYTCDCSDQRLTDTRYTNAIHPLLCLPDPCFPTLKFGIPHPSALGLRIDSRGVPSCSCGSFQNTRLFALEVPDRFNPCVNIDPPQERNMKSHLIYDTNESHTHCVGHTYLGGIDLGRGVYGGGGIFVPHQMYFGHDIDDPIQLENNYFKRNVDVIPGCYDPCRVCDEIYKGTIATYSTLAQSQMPVNEQDKILKVLNTNQNFCSMDPHVSAKCTIQSRTKMKQMPSIRPYACVGEWKEELGEQYFKDKNTKPVINLKHNIGRIELQELQEEAFDMYNVQFPWGHIPKDVEKQGTTQILTFEQIKNLPLLPKVKDPPPPRPKPPVQPQHNIWDDARPHGGILI